MNRGYLFSVRGARLVALGRALLAVFMVLSTLLGPPAANAGADLLILGNLAWALGLFGIARSRRRVYDLLSVSMPIAALDLVIYTALLYATSGAESPFFSPFIVLMLGATIQWGSRGATVMGALTLLAFLPAGLHLNLDDPDGTAAQTFILRLGYMGIVAVLLSAFGGHVERIVQELSRLSDPFGEEADDSTPPVRACLRHALSVFRARRGLLLLEEEDEPWATLFVLEDGHLTSHRLVCGAGDWIDAKLGDAVFLLDCQGRITASRGRRDIWPTNLGPLAPELGIAQPFERALVIPAGAGAMKASVLVLDHREPAAEDLSVGAMVGAQISVALELWDSQRTRRAASAAEERIRFARDLHDGVLQFLAGAGLQLEALAADSRLDADLRARVQQMRSAFSDEASELRGFISTLRPARAQGAPRRSLSHDLNQLTERLSRHWSIDVAAEVEQAELLVPGDLIYDLSRIVREAVANGVRHGGARRIRVWARAERERLNLRVEDDGRGFPAHACGRGDDAPAGQPLVTPRTLGERVRALGGRMSVRSSDQGASVIIDLPMPSA